MSHKRPIRFSLLCVSLLSMIAGTQAGIYKWVDTDGRVQFSDRPPSEGSARQVELPEINTCVEGYEEREDTRSRGPMRGKSRKVVMYSASWCAVCARARRFFQAEGIPVRELDIEKSQSARRDWKHMNATGVPVVLVGGKRMSGFSEKRFMDLYLN